MGVINNYAFGFIRRETTAITNPTPRMIADGTILSFPRKPVDADVAASGVQILLIKLSRPIAAIRIPIAVPQSFVEPRLDFVSLAIVFLLN
jgi:hypothetical protein